MFVLLKKTMIALVACVIVGQFLPAGPPPGVAPPNWKGSASGSTVLNHFYQDGNNDFHRVDDDTFAGKSTHLGRFTATGAHDLNLTTFAFVGYATWTASDGDTIDVVYSGQVFPPSTPPGDPPYPYGAYPFTAVATLSVVGGTGRFANAQGEAELSGGFSGDGTLVPVPEINVFSFDFEGNIYPQGN